MKKSIAAFASLVVAAVCGFCAAACGGKGEELDFSHALPMGETAVAGGIELRVTQACFDLLSIAPERDEAILKLYVSYEGRDLDSASTTLTEKNGRVRAFYAGDGLDYLGYNRPADGDAFVRFSVKESEREFLFAVAHGGESVEYRIVVTE